MEQGNLFAQYLLFRLLGFIANFLSIQQRITLGKFIGRFLIALNRKRYNITLNNIQAAFHDIDNIQVKNIALKSYQNLGITLVELLSFPKIINEGLDQLVKYENIELIYEKYKEKKGLILISGHYGNWELLALSAGVYSGLCVNVIVKDQKNIYSNRYLTKLRQIAGNNLINMNKAGKESIKILRDGGIIAMLADQSANPKKDTFVDFFGRKAATYESLATLALKYNAPIIVGYAIRSDDGTYSVKLEEIKFDDLQGDSQAVYKLTQRHVKHLEDTIRIKPELWSWQHRRWKHEPPK